jgi:hypothetical protein
LGEPVQANPQEAYIILINHELFINTAPAGLTLNQRQKRNVSKTGEGLGKGFLMMIIINYQDDRSSGLPRSV